MSLEWNVFRYDINKDKIVAFNIFNHWKFDEDVQKSLKKFKDKGEFAEQLRRDLQYYFWSRAEYELIIEVVNDNRIILKPWCGCREPEQTKIDVTDDKSLCWRNFAEEHTKRQIYKNKAKIDIYDQVMFNWDNFLELVWNSRKRYKKR